MGLSYLFVVMIGSVVLVLAPPIVCAIVLPPSMKGCFSLLADRFSRFWLWSIVVGIAMAVVAAFQAAEVLTGVLAAATGTLFMVWLAGLGLIGIAVAERVAVRSSGAEAPRGLHNFVRRRLRNLWR